MNKIDEKTIDSLKEMLVSVLNSKKSDYQYYALYNLADFPIPLLPVYSSGCSKTVDAGGALGKGRFCDYLIIGAGTSITIFYNRFEPYSAPA